MSERSSSGGGVGLAGLVFAVFLTLKLAGIGAVATWSWWWVTSPLWIGFALAVGFFLIMLAGVTGVGLLDRVFRGRNVRLK